MPDSPDRCSEQYTDIPLIIGQDPPQLVTYSDGVATVQRSEMGQRAAASYRTGVVDEFVLGMRMMRKHDPQAQEDGFHLIKDVAKDHVPALVAAYHEENDRGLRCWLLELIGEAESPEAFPVLSSALVSDDESIRHWARVGLQRLNSKEARTLLWPDRNQPSP